MSLSYPAFAQPELRGALVDTHFSERGRQGRLLAFLARFLVERGRTEVVGVGLDEGTALVLGGGRWRASGPPDKSVWFYRVTGPARLAPGAPLELEGIRRVRVDARGGEGAWPPDFASAAAERLRVVGGVVRTVQP